MKELDKEYLLLFNGISDAVTGLERMSERLKILQAEAEALVMQREEEEEKSEAEKPANNEKETDGGTAPQEKGQQDE